MMMATSPQFDRRLNIVLGISVTLMFGVALFAMVAIPAILSSNDNSGQLRRSAEISACRSVLSADVTDARSQLDSDRTNLEILTSEGLSASVNRDGARLSQLVAESAVVLESLDTDKARLRAANDLFVQQTRLSQTDEGAFLRVCRSVAQPDPDISSASTSPSNESEN